MKQHYLYPAVGGELWAASTEADHYSLYVPDKRTSDGYRGQVSREFVKVLDETGQLSPVADLPFWVSGDDLVQLDRDGDDVTVSVRDDSHYDPWNSATLSPVECASLAEALHPTPPTIGYVVSVCMDGQWTFWGACYRIAADAKTAYQDARPLRRPFKVCPIRDAAPVEP